MQLVNNTENGMSKEINNLSQTELVCEVLRLQERVTRLTNQREILQSELLDVHLNRVKEGGK